MTSGPLETYLQELARALRERGHEASRIVDESREHLADAVEDGLRRGLAREEAEREAVERFGPADLIAAQAPMRSHLMARLTVALDTIVGNWRWMTAATAGAALLASTASYYLLPTFYRSESVIVVVPQPLRPESLVPLPSRDRMQAITQTILSNARLDRIVQEFRLGTTQQARRDISVMVTTPEQAGASAPLGMFKVSFQSPDPQLSMKVTERLTSLFILENLEDQARTASAIGDQFRVEKRPNLPRDPLRPGLAKMTVSGAFAGLALSIGALIFRRPTR